MLPLPTSPDFPAALKAARLKKGMSRPDLARAAKVHPVMIRRYEEPEAANFTRPRMKTCEYLNSALGFHPSSSVPEFILIEPGSEPSQPPVTLDEASIDQIVAKLRARGAAVVTLTFQD